MWWAQEGVSACLRCPQVVTNDSAPSDSVVETASYLDAHDVSFSRSDQRLVVPHAFACGVLIEFTEMGDRR